MYSRTDVPYVCCCSFLNTFFLYLFYPPALFCCCAPTAASTVRAATPGNTAAAAAAAAHVMSGNMWLAPKLPHASPTIPLTTQPTHLGRVRECEIKDVMVSRRQAKVRVDHTHPHRSTSMCTSPLPQRYILTMCTNHSANMHAGLACVYVHRNAGHRKLWRPRRNTARG